MRKYYNKLVRDNMPRVIESEGLDYSIRTLVGEDLLTGLRKKLLEEAQELLDADSDENLLEEIADVKTVLEILGYVAGFTEQQIKDKMDQKYIDRGSFWYGVYLEYIDYEDGKSEGHWKSGPETITISEST